MNSHRLDIDPRVWTVDRIVKQVVFLAQDGGAGANFLQYLLGQHTGFFQQFDRHIPENNEYISSMPLFNAEHVMHTTTRNFFFTAWTEFTPFLMGHVGKR